MAKQIIQEKNDELISKPSDKKLLSHSKSSLKKELRLWFLLLALVPLTLISIFNYLQSSQSLLAAAESELTHSAALSKRFIKNWMKYRFIDIKNLAEAKSSTKLLQSLNASMASKEQTLFDFINSYDWTRIADAQQKDINSFSQKYDYVYDVLLTDLNGNIIFSLIQEEDFGSNLFSLEQEHIKLANTVKQSIDTGQTLFSDIERYKPSNYVLASFITSPLYNEKDEMIGVMIVQLTLDSVFSMLETTTSPDSSLKHYLVAEDGFLRTPYDSEHWEQVLNKNINTEQFLLWKSEHGSNSNAIHDDDEIEQVLEYIGPVGKRVVGLHQSIKLGNLKWGLISEIDQEEAFSSATLIAKTTLAFFVITTLIVFFIALVIAKRISAPLSKLVDSSLAIAAGKTEKAVKVSSNNEIGQLARAFNYMVKARQHYVEELYKSNHEAQAALIALNEQRYALDQHAIVAITDLKGTITFANQKFADISGYSIKELLGQNHRIVNSGYHSSQFWKSMYHTLVSGNVFQGEIRNRKKDGAIYWLETTIVPFIGSNNRVKNYISIRTDITQRKFTEMALAENTKQLELVAKSTNVGIWDWYISSGNIQCNERWFEIAGYIKGEISPFTTENWQALIHPDDLSKSTTLIENHFDDELQPYSCELRIKHKAGHWVWVTNSGKVVERTVTGLPQRMIGTLLDITPLKAAHFAQEKINKRTQIKLAASEALSVPSRLEKKLENALKAIQRIENPNFSNKCGICLINQSSQKLELVAYQGEFRENETKLINNNCVNLNSYTNAIASSKLTLISTASALQQNEGEQCSDPTSASGLAVSCQEIDNQYVFPLTSTFERQKQVLGILIIYIKDKQSLEKDTLNLLNEISEMISTAIIQERTRSLLKEASIEAEQSSKLKSEFLASMSHEIRTPMNGVLGMLGLLLNSNLNEEQLHKANLANSSAESLLTVINDILDFSKIEAGKLELELIDFDLRGMLGEFSESMALVAQDKGLEFVLDVKQVQQTLVKGDQGRIRQILTNLVGNAIKFTHEGEVVITAQTNLLDNKQMQLSVSITDTGIGIPQKKIDRLFETFTQVDASTTREYGGTGLGLSICKSLCKLMHGHITVSSTENLGSTFLIQLLIESSEKSMPVIPQINIEKLHVLIVDDNVTNRAVLCGQLELWGANVKEASSAVLAMAMCEERFLSTELPFFDVALLDMQMPEIDGIELGKMLKADKRFINMKLVMMTSISQGNEASFFCKNGFSAYFPKPATTADLFNALAIVVEDGEALHHVPIATHSYLQTLTDNLKQSNKHNDTWPQKTKLMLVEDNRINQHVALGILSELGLKADIAVNGRKAISLLAKAPENSPYTAILMDCQMPIMDGYQATKEIRLGNAGNRNKQIPIIAMTANAMEGDREKCISAGMSDYLTKPIEQDKLKQALITWLYTDTPFPANFSSDKTKKNEKEISKKITEAARTDDNSENKQQPIIDKKAVLKRISGRQQLLSMLVDNFITDYPEHIETLKQAYNDNNKELMHLIAHTFKGMSANLGGMRLTQQALLLELSLKKNNTNDIESLIDALIAEAQIFIRELKAFDQEMKNTNES